MASLTTRALLTRAAEAYIGEKKAFSKEEIVKRVNEIKYLSSQKKVPKLTLRKEIIHLETRLQDIFELEKKMYAKEKAESIKVSALKKEITLLKKRIATSEDKDLQKKVDKLSHLLGETLARKVSVEDVALTREISHKDKVNLKSGKNKLEMVQTLLDRLKIVRKEVMARKEINPKIVEKMEEKIDTIGKKLMSYFPEEAPVIVENKPRHKIIFAAPEPVKIDEMAIEKELPLPPPPRMS
jgi:hypothetical protein